ncbi:MAG: ThiF family adenylyltransferase, partial [Clostridiales Family XIII bacterium]|nr:ThiF family adenylyltransferase [Clostridiales Family XIII bacterium]
KTFDKKVQIPRYLGISNIYESGCKCTIEFGFSKPLKSVIEANNKKEILKLLSYCLKPISARSLAKKMNFDRAEIVTICNQLLHEGILELPYKLPKSYLRYDRHTLFYKMNGLNPINAQKKISKVKIALIGMGGIGNWVALNFIGMGFKELKLIDFDRIEVSNLTRQVLFNEKDIGKLKTDIAKRVLSSKNTQTKITGINLKIDGLLNLKKYLRGIDFVVLSADRPTQIHDWVDSICIKNNIPYINLGYKDGTGIIGPLTVPGITSCYQCHKSKQYTLSTGNDQLDNFMQKVDTRYQAPSFGPLNSMVSSIGATEVIKYVLGLNCESLSTELSIDPLSLIISKTLYQKDHKCWNCSSSKVRKG